MYWAQVRNWLEKQGISQGAVARKAGVSAGYVSAVMLSADAVEAALDELGCPARVLEEAGQKRVSSTHDEERWNAANSTLVNPFG